MLSSSFFYVLQRSTKPATKDPILRMNEAIRRVILRVFTKIMVLIAFAGLTWVYWDYLTHSDTPTEHPALDIDLRGLAPGEYLIVRWNDQTLYVWHRTPEMLDQLVGYEDQLYDPDSLYSQQPEAAKNPYRSMYPRYLVVFARNTATGCDTVVAPVDMENVPVSPWFGGFKDTCQEAYFDLAGRIYTNQQIRYNLEVPPYQLIGERLILMEAY